MIPPAVTRLAVLAAVLGPVLVACGGNVFTGAPYAGNIEPQTVPRVTTPADPDDEAAAPPQARVVPATADGAIQLAQAGPIAGTPAVGPLPRPATQPRFPNLADVPPRPVDLPTVEERQRVLQELQADQARGSAAVSGAGAAAEPAGGQAR